jgi:hypothetical protein
MAADDHRLAAHTDGARQAQRGGGQRYRCGVPSLHTAALTPPVTVACPHWPLGCLCARFIMCYIWCCRLASMWLLLSAVEEEKRSGVVFVCGRGTGNC